MTSQQRAMRRFRARDRLAAAERRLLTLQAEQARQQVEVDDTDYGWHRRRYLPVAIANARATIAAMRDEIAMLEAQRQYARRAAA